MSKLTVTSVFRRNQKSQKRINLNRGSIRSSKTYSLVQLAVLWLVEPYRGPHQVWSITRWTLPALKATAYRDFKEIIDKLELWPYIKSNLTELTFTFGNRMVELFSLDEETKVKSRKRTHLHIMEVTEITYRMWTDLITRTSGKVYCCFNPDDPYHWIREKVEIERSALIGDVETIISTYRDNPYLEPEIVREIEILRDTNPELWKVYGQGEYGVLEDVIFPDYRVELYPDYCEQEVVGIDFGFSHDPAAVLLVGRYGRTLYLKELVYERGLLNNALAALIKEHGVQHLPMVADSAEPKSIAALRAEGLNVAASIKGRDSLRASIMAVKEFELVVDPGSINLLKELRMYRWSDKKAGVPQGSYDDLLACLRYAVTKFYSKGQRWRTGEVVSGTRKFQA